MARRCSSTLLKLKNFEKVKVKKGLCLGGGQTPITAMVVKKDISIWREDGLALYRI